MAASQQSSGPPDWVSYFFGTTHRIDICGEVVDADRPFTSTPRYLMNPTSRG
jgi:hypothetical protein